MCQNGIISEESFDQAPETTSLFYPRSNAPLYDFFVALGQLNNSARSIDGEQFLHLHNSVSVFFFFFSLPYCVLFLGRAFLAVWVTWLFFLHRESKQRSVIGGEALN